MLVNLNEVLKSALADRYAVGLFNVCNLEMARGVMEAAEELQTPVIIGTAEALLPSAPLEMVADLLIPAAERASVPVVVHLDHGLTEDVCRQALDLGFTSIMLDCSMEPYARNVERVARMAETAHRYGATIEGELGHVGDNQEDGKTGDPALLYTEPDQANDYVLKTGADALAIAVGTAHGAYKLPPKLDFDRIRAIHAETDAYLVLHGGSGLTDTDFRQAIDAGISKINIFTDINQAAAQAAYDMYTAGVTGMTSQQPAMAEAVRREAHKKLRLFKNRD